MNARRTFGPALIGALLLASWVGSANAAMITVNFEADFSSASLDLLGAGYGTGDVTGSLSYDTNTADEASLSTLGVYVPTPGLFSFSGGGNSATASAYDILVRSLPFSEFEARAITTSSSTGATGWSIREILLILEDPTGTAVTSDALPTALNLSDFATRSFLVVLEADDLVTRNTAYYSVTSLSFDESVPVPVPTTLLLFGLGLAGLGFGMRRR